MDEPARLLLRRRLPPALLTHAYALLLGGSYLVSGLLDRPELLFGPLALCGLLVAIVIGITRSADSTAARRLAGGLGWGLLWSLFCVAPFGLRWAWLRFEASFVPHPADWTTTVSVDPVLFNAKPDYIVRHESDQTIPEMARESFDYFDSQLGYSAGIGSPHPFDPESEIAVAPRLGSGVTLKFERGHRSLFVMIWSEQPEGAETTVYIFPPDGVHRADW